MALFTLRAADEVRAAQFPSAEGDLDPEMVAITRAIIAQRSDKFDPSTYRDCYQEALRELIEAKMKGLPIKPRAVPEPPPVIDLMAALKRSLAQEGAARGTRVNKEQGTKAAPDRRHPSLLLSVSGGRRGKGEGGRGKGEPAVQQKQRKKVRAPPIAKTRGRTATVPMLFVPLPV